MTREEAIQWLTDIKENITENWSQDVAIDMAIEALHREEAEEKGYCHRINYIPKPCENANCDCVAVVRCKDCKHYIVEGITTQYGWCHEYKHSVNDDDFCSYGERREP